MAAQWDGVKADLSGVWAAVSDKRHVSRLSGLENNINEHFSWLAGNGPPGKDPGKFGDKWKRDIQRSIDEMRKRLDRLKSDKKREDWQQRIEQLEQRLKDA